METDMPTFIPDPIAVREQEVPYFEDSQALDIPGRGTHKKVQTLQHEVIQMLARLGAASVQFVPGTYDDGPRQRVGFQVQFWYGSVQGRIDCAALPLRVETPRQKDRALAQALYLLRDELQAMVHSQVYKPGAVPLIPYLIGPNGQTVTEYLVETQNVPQLAARV
jgi:hypothetical protein